MANYSVKKNVLQLVALMISHGVKRVILCPGSRDIPLVQTILSSGKFETWSITDERSAGFFALGLAQERNNREPVAVVVTSGSSLLNLHPAVSEAFYQQIPLLVISADRPKAWIGQMDGQTLPQEDVFRTLVRKSVSLVEIQSPEDEWYVNRMVNEALLELDHHGKGPVHINVPVSDPFFDFSVTELPHARVIRRYDLNSYRQLELQQRLYDDQNPLDVDLEQERLKQLESFNAFRCMTSAGCADHCHGDCCRTPAGSDASCSDCNNYGSMESWAQALAGYLAQSGSIMLVVGQSLDGLSCGTSHQLWTDLSSSMVVLAETITNVEYAHGICTQVDLFISELSVAAPLIAEDRANSPRSVSYARALTPPDLVITVGGHIISKNLRRFLRTHRPANHLHVSPDGSIADLFKCVTGVVEMDGDRFIKVLHRAVAILKERHPVDLKAIMEGAAEECKVNPVASCKSTVETLRRLMRNTRHTLPDLARSRALYASLARNLMSVMCTPGFDFSHMNALDRLMSCLPDNTTVHLANSSTVRYAQIFGNRGHQDRNITVLSNRGVNGIEGSLSTAIGYASASSRLNVIIIGDLSFFYDMNALWNEYVRSNVRILLLNNGGGEIFHALPGLSLDEAGKKYVTAQHHSQAKGWAESRGFKYISISSDDEVDAALDELIAPLDTTDKPVMVEFFTRATTDALTLGRNSVEARRRAYEALVK